MACFIVPAAEAIVSTVITKKLEKYDGEKNNTIEIPDETKHHVSSRKMKWLNSMLWGGSALLAFEHLWHGEIVPFFPFLTAAANPEDAYQMLHEMGTVGVTMSITVTAVWMIMVWVSGKIAEKEKLLKMTN